MAYLLLSVAIVAEVIATSALKASANFTRLIPTLLVISGYATSFYLMTLVIRTIPLGITYAIWSGAGIILVALIGTIFYREVPDAPACLGMVLIIAGIAVIRLFSKTAGS